MKATPTEARREDESGGGAPFVHFRCKPDGAVPVVISVPHAGREYPTRLIAASRHPVATLRRLEDRYADLLIDRLRERGFEAIVVSVPRAMIDLNRDLRDIDVRGVTDVPHGTALIQTAKQRGGLGLFPYCVAGVDNLWRRPIDWAEAQRRIARIHAPFHSAVGQALDRHVAAFGQAVLLDVHSMPPLKPRNGEVQPEIVVGDRFGASASARFAALAQEVARDHRFRVALNTPYPGTYILERHGRPARGRHALQIEIARDLYLDSPLDRPGPGLSRVQAMLADLAQALADEITNVPWAEAAE